MVLFSFLFLYPFTADTVVVVFSSGGDGSHASPAQLDEAIRHEPKKRRQKAMSQLITSHRRQRRAAGTIQNKQGFEVVTLLLPPPPTSPKKKSTRKESNIVNNGPPCEHATESRVGEDEEEKEGIKAVPRSNLEAL
jgi:hypothetical protein